MKVKELIQLLEQQDQEAEVMVMSQPQYPFEYSLTGITTRAKIKEAEAEEGYDLDDNEDSDVFLVEGDQVRYGSKTAWDIAER